MNQLQIINQNGQLLADSREVAEMTDKNHADLLRDIRRYMETLGKSNFALADFFIESYYNDSQGKPRLHYHLTKKGCDMVANKMTGEKGILFTATYVIKFEEMQQQLNQPKSQLEILQSSINQLIEQEQKVKHLETQLTTVNHRLDNMDSIDTVGDLQQRLNKMIKRYAWQNGFNMGNAWKQFDQSFNTAFRTNLTSLKNNYSKKHGFEKLTRPQYLSLTNQLEDGLRVADKMLNQKGEI